MQRVYEQSALANEAKQAKRDGRKADAIAHYDSGLEANEIAKTMGISTRTANRYLESHIEITPETIKTGLRVNLIAEKKGNLMYRAPGTHYWVIRKVYNRDGDPYAELERQEHPDGTAYLQVRIANLCRLATKARQSDLSGHTYAESNEE